MGGRWSRIRSNGFAKTEADPAYTPGSTEPDPESSTGRVNQSGDVFEVMKKLRQLL